MEESTFSLDRGSISLFAISLGDPAETPHKLSHMANGLSGQQEDPVAKEVGNAHLRVYL